MDPELNQACRLITGTLKATPLPALYRLASIAPPAVRRNIAAKKEKKCQQSYPRHPLHNHQEVRRRLKSRRSFATVVELADDDTSKGRLEKWSAMITPGEFPAVPPASESFTNGTDLRRKEWCSLNRARCKVGQTRAAMTRWGYADDPHCDCGGVQTVDHILTQCPNGPSCSDEDLKVLTGAALTWLHHWSEKI